MMSGRLFFTHNMIILNVLSFDLINAPAIFQAYINYVLCGLVDNFCIVYLDDILIFSKIEEEHYQHLELIIKHLQHVKLYTNPKKYKFFKTKLKYLDFLVNKKSLHMNSSHVKIISEWRSHLFKIYQDIQVFIEFCNFY